MGYVKDKRGSCDSNRLATLVAEQSLSNPRLFCTSYSISHWGYHDDVADRHSIFISLSLTLFENDIFAEYLSLSACLSRSITPLPTSRQSILLEEDTRFAYDHYRIAFLLDQLSIAYRIGDFTKSNISWSFSESRERQVTSFGCE